MATNIDSEYVWKLVEIECVGPLPYNGEEVFVLKMTDVFSKWISFIPLKEKTCNNIAITVCAEFRLLKIPFAIRLIYMDSKEAEKISSLIEKRLTDDYLEINEASKLMKLIDGVLKHSLHICVEKVQENSNGTLDSFESFVDFVKMTNCKNINSQNMFYIFVGQCSLVNKEIREWHSEVLNKFVHLNPTTWIEKMSCFLLSLRSSIPPSSAVPPTSLIFHKEWSIFNPVQKISSTLQNVKALDQPSSSSLKQEEQDAICIDEEDDEEDDYHFLNIPCPLKRKYRLKDLEIPLVALPSDVVRSAKKQKLCLSISSKGICTCGKHVEFKKTYENSELEFYEVNYKGPRNENGISSMPSQIKNSIKSSIVESSKDIPSGVPSKCSHCDKVYLTSDPEFGVHLKCHIVGLSGFHCFLCQKNTNTWNLMISHLEEHIEIKHKIKEVKKCTMTSTICPICKKNFHFRNRFINHLKSVHFECVTENCKICGKKISKNGENPSTSSVHKILRNQNDDDIRYPLQCDCCSDTYVSSEVEKSLHADCHKDGKNTRCPLCTYSNKPWNDMLNHMKTHELFRRRITEIEKFIEKERQCPHCHKLFNTVIEMMAHLKPEHFSNNFYQCKICWKAYKDENDLKDHMVIHISVNISGQNLEPAGQSKKEEPLFRTKNDRNSERSEGSSSNSDFPGVEGIKKYEVKQAFKCPRCDRILIKEVEFHIHLQCHVPGKRGFKCFYCPETQIHWTKMLCHLKMHKFVRKTILSILFAKKNLERRKNRYRRRHGHRWWYSSGEKKQRDREKSKIQGTGYVGYGAHMSQRTAHAGFRKEEIKNTKILQSIKDGSEVGRTLSLEKKSEKKVSDMNLFPPLKLEPENEASDDVKHISTVKLEFECEIPDKDDEETNLPLELNFEVQPDDAKNDSKCSEEPPVPFKCDICNYSTRMRLKLNLHKRIHEGKVYPCGLCNTAFPCKFLLKRHFAIIHLRIFKTHNQRKYASFSSKKRVIKGGHSKLKVTSSPKE